MSNVEEHYHEGGSPPIEPGQGVPGRPIGIEEMLDLLFGSIESGYVVAFSGRQSERPDARTNELDDTRQQSYSWPKAKKAVAKRLVSESEKGRDSYFGIHLFEDSGNRKADNALDQVGSAWVDGDGAQPSEGCPPPNIEVDSSPGRQQFHWLLDKPVDPETASQLSKRLAYRMGADKGKWGLGTVLRPPETRNFKRDEPHDVKAYLVREERYDPDELDRLIPSAEELFPGSRRKSSKGSPTRSITPGDGPPVRLHGKAREIYDGMHPILGERGNVDRSATLYQIAGVLYRGGAERSVLVPALEERDQALGFGKYLNRPDEYERIVDKLEAEGLSNVVDMPVTNGRSSGSAATALTEGGSSGGGSRGVGVNAAGPTPTRFPHTDTGNAERLVARHGKDIRYCYARKTWYVWDGVRWARDEGGEVMRRAKETVRSIYAEAAAEPEADMRKSVARHARLSESKRAREAMIALAQSEPGVSVEVEEMDRDLWLFNVVNGTLELRTGELREHRREDMITKLSPVVYDPDARSEVLERYMGFATRGKPGLAEFLWRAVGYSLTGDTSTKALYFLHGAKDTGKTTFVEMIRATLGDYADTLDFEALLAFSRGGKGGPAPRPEIAKLPGRRFVASSEVREGSKLATELIKALTGWDSIEVRTVYEKPFTFIPQCKLWLAANHAPRVPEDDEAAWERINRIPFDNEPEKKLPEIASHLRDPEQGGPAILAAAVRGCLEFQRRGLDPPEVVCQATREYRDDQGVLWDFLNEHCVLGEGLWVPTGQLREAYEQWGRENGETNLLKGRKWGNTLKDHGCTPGHASGGSTRIWRGIALVGGPDGPDDGARSGGTTRDVTDSETQKSPANEQLRADAMTESDPASESFAHNPVAKETFPKNPSQSVIRYESVTDSPGDSRCEQHEAVEWDEGWARALMARAVRYVAERHVEGDALVDDSAENEEIRAAKGAEDPARYREAVRAWTKAQLREFRLRQEAAETAEAKSADDALVTFLKDPPGWWARQAEECIRQGSPARLVKPLVASTASKALGSVRCYDEALAAVEAKLREMGAGEGG